MIAVPRNGTGEDGYSQEGHGGDEAPGDDEPRAQGGLAEGREQGLLVRRYLEALESHRPKRGRRRTPEGIAKRLSAIDELLPAADALTRLHLAQERMDLEQELGTAAGNAEDLEELEAAFIEVAAAYGEQTGLTYEA